MTQFYENASLDTGFSRVHKKTSQFYFIKWTTSGEPPVGLRNPLKDIFGEISNNFRTGRSVGDGVH